jgi:tRNA A-37 threonylcarbamoyl transferase component Bud32
MQSSDTPRLVKPPQSRHGHGSSAVFIEPAVNWGVGGRDVYVKRQDGYCCRPIWRLFRRTPTLRRELRGLAACQRMGIAVPGVVRYHEVGESACLILTEVHDALPLDQALALPGADRAAIVRSVAMVIGSLHARGWCHGALYPSHILVRANPAPEVVLIDLEKAHFSPLRRRRDLNRLWRHFGALSAAEARTFNVAYSSARQRRTQSKSTSAITIRVADCHTSLHMHMPADD